MATFEQQVQLRFREHMFSLHVSGSICDSGIVHSTAIADSPDGFTIPTNNTKSGTIAQSTSKDPADISGSVMRVSLEELNAQPHSSAKPTNRWCAEFPAIYIEDITIKTGNYKKFPIFVEMMLSAMRRPNSTVSLDLLTPKDLDMVKSDSHGVSAKLIDDSKMYLIITYAVAFDRVHYPLPLVKVMTPSLAATKDSRHEELTRNLTSLYAENDFLRDHIKTLELATHSIPARHDTQSKLERELQSVLVATRRRLRDALKQHPREKFSEYCKDDRLAKPVQSRKPSVSGHHRGSRVHSHSSSSAGSIRQGSPHLTARSGYKVIKSEPLHAPRRDSQTRAPKSNISLDRRKPSMSPFRRFDPTQYVIDKERKQADRRSQSLHMMIYVVEIKSIDQEICHTGRHHTLSHPIPVKGKSFLFAVSFIYYVYIAFIDSPTHKRSRGRGDDERGSREYTRSPRSSVTALRTHSNSNTTQPSRMKPSGHIPISRFSGTTMDDDKGTDDGDDGDDNIEQRLAKLQMYLASVSGFNHHISYFKGLTSISGSYSKLSTKAMAPMRFDRAVVKYVASALDLGPHPGEDLERRLAAATSYDEWRCIALELDILNGNQAWKATQDTSLYDHKLIYTRLQSLRQNCASGDLETLIILLRSGLLRNLGGISDVRLYKHSLTGTKILIEDYLKEVVTQFDTIYNSGFSVLNGAQKALMFNDTQQSFGCTALLLQGGVTFGMYHIGVVKSLFERGLLPRIISGTSVGALIAALVCIHTDVELPGIFSPGGINLEPFSRKDSKGAISRKISRILKHGYLLDVSVIEQCVKENLGDYTFKEAYLRTGRILNIPVAAYRKGEIPQLLNYLTAPKVLIRSAACAAVGLVGLYQTRDLLAKSKDGSIFTWCPSDFDSVQRHVLFVNNR
ncbi:hypothetical protein BSLG_004116 [Batrachochytrium salamandrivorans]|nr:hypothetical protein BSLG_004116 [Batrachochytrium salamandrivorans]